MTRLRGILIGTGGVARQAHLPGFLEGEGVADRLEIVATVDPAAPAGPLPGIPHFREVREAAASGPIDFIDICTPTATHVDMALWGLQAGYHVLCEKPVALSEAEVARLRAARRPGQVLMACHQYRYHPAWRQIRAWLDEGRIGEWHLAEFQVHRTGADPGLPGGAGTPWRGRRAAARGGILLDHGTHLIYQALDAAGMPQRVQCWTGRLRHAGYDVEDTAHLLLDGGTRVVVLFLTWGGAGRENRIRFVGRDGLIDWSGGRLRLESRHGSLTRDMSAELAKEGYYRWFARLFHQFADRIERKDGEDALEDIARVARILEAAYRSDATGCRLAL
jgi:predicted dehydrogenase